MSTRRSKNKNFTECESCGTFFNSEDKLKHLEHCPTIPGNTSYCYIKNQSLFAMLRRRDDQIDGLDGLQELNWGYLNSLCMEICGIAQSNWVVLKVYDSEPFVKKARAIEDGLSSVHLEKPVYDLYFGKDKNYPNVSVTKLTSEKKFLHAKEIILESETTEITKDIQRRLTLIYNEAILTPGNRIVIKYYGKYLKFSVKEVIPQNEDFDTESGKLTISDIFYEVTKKTKWVLFKENVKEKYPFSKICGLDTEIKEIQLHMDILFKDPVSVCKSVLLYGSSGTGKTILADALAKASVTKFVIRVNNLNNDSDEIEELFKKALHTPKTVIILDDIENMCPKRSKTSGIGQLSQELVSLYEEIHENNLKVFIIATTKDIHSIDPRVKNKVFEMQFEIPIPKPHTRKDILTKMISEIGQNISEEQLSEISLRLRGYVGRDILEMCNKAKEHMYFNSREMLDFEDLKFGLKETTPSAMDDYLVEVPDVKWSDIAGQKKLKVILKKAVEDLSQNSETKKRKTKSSQSVLMYGPPGCSKTMIAKALATESGFNFISVKGPDVFNKYVGESERAVRDLFKKAKQVAPSIIFFDEIDALGGGGSSGVSSGCSVQERVLTTLLTEMDGVEPLENVIVLGATNRPDRINPALLRAGRFSKKIYVPLPDDETREEIFKLHLSKMRVDSSVDIKYLVESTRGFSGAEITEVCIRAEFKMADGEVAGLQHFEYGLEDVFPITTEESLRLYEEFRRPRRATRVENPSNLTLNSDEKEDSAKRINIDKDIVNNESNKEESVS